MGSPEFPASRCGGPTSSGCGGSPPGQGWRKEQEGKRLRASARSGSCFVRYYCSAGSSEGTALSSVVAPQQFPAGGERRCGCACGVGAGCACWLIAALLRGGSSQRRCLFRVESSEAERRRIIRVWGAIAWSGGICLLVCLCFFPKGSLTDGVCVVT